MGIAVLNINKLLFLRRAARFRLRCSSKIGQDATSDGGVIGHLEFFQGEGARVRLNRMTVHEDSVLALVRYQDVRSLMESSPETGAKVVGAVAVAVVESMYRIRFGAPECIRLLPAVSTRLRGVFISSLARAVTA